MLYFLLASLSHDQPSTTDPKNIISSPGSSGFISKVTLIQMVEKLKKGVLFGKGRGRARGFYISVAILLNSFSGSAQCKTGLCSAKRLLVIGDAPNRRALPDK